MYLPTSAHGARALSAHKQNLSQRSQESPNTNMTAWQQQVLTIMFIVEVDDKIGVFLHVKETWDSRVYIEYITLDTDSTVTVAHS